MSKVGPVSNAGVYQIAKDFSTNVAKDSVKVKHEAEAPQSQKSEKDTRLISSCVGRQGPARETESAP